MSIEKRKYFSPLWKRRKKSVKRRGY